MKHREGLWEFVIAFLVCTACITVLEGVMGMLFFPEEKIGYDAFFSPPVFGFFPFCSEASPSQKRSLESDRFYFADCFTFL